MSKNRSNYQKLQIALASGSGLIILLYGILYFGEFLGPGELLGTSPLNLMIAILHVAYFFLLRSFLNNKSTLAATGLDLLLFSTNIAILLLVTGGFRSIYFIFWMFIILVAAALGRAVVFAYMGITLLYLGLATYLSVDGSMYLANNITHAAAAIAAGFLGMWLWRHHPVNLKDDSEYSELSSKLETEQLKSEILLKSIGDGVVVIDLSGKVQLFNEPACSMTGWPQKEAVGISYESILSLDDEKGNKLPEGQEPFHRAIASKSTVRRNDITMLSRDNRRISLSIVASPIFSGAGSVSGAIGVFRDISAEKAAARQRDEFISTASHEMRTPVAAIEGFLALALNEKVSSIDENARKYIDKAHESTQHLGNLFRDLLSITKIEDGRIKNEPEPFELGKVIKTSIDELNFKAEKKGIELKLKATQGTSLTGQSDVLPLFYVNADPERIREVFINLVDNAIKFTPKGEVNVSVEGDDKQVTVGVHDQGIGIPKDEIGHLFQKFYRVDSTKTREIGGTGLGLYLCRTIIEMYNGRIWVESEENKGSHFYFTLPRLSYAQVQEIRAKMEKQKKAEAQEGEDSPGDTVAPSTTSK